MVIKIIGIVIIVYLAIGWIVTGIALLYMAKVDHHGIIDECYDILYKDVRFVALSTASRAACVLFTCLFAMLYGIVTWPQVIPSFISKRFKTKK